MCGGVDAIHGNDILRERERVIKNIKMVRKRTKWYKLRDPRSSKTLRVSLVTRGQKNQESNSQREF